MPSSVRGTDSTRSPSSRPLTARSSSSGTWAIRVTEVPEVVLFLKQMHTWTDPWGKETLEGVLQSLGEPKFTQHPDVRVGTGYGQFYDAPRIEIEGVGVFTRMENRIDYSGGAWWNYEGTNALGYRLHDKRTASRERVRFLSRGGFPISGEAIFN